MSDVKDILGVSQQGVSTSSTVDSILKKKDKPKTPKIEGATRGGSTMDKLQQAFLNLEGETLTFASPVTNLGLKEKRKVKVSWERRGFRNSSRSDNMVLYHFSKSNEKIDDYRYCRFNKKMEVLIYNEEEYDLYLRDADWTKEDTDQLLDLAKKFDTRFIVVHDRYEGSVPRSIEDLKDRYYKIQSKLVELRAKPEEDPYHNPLTNYNFNKVYESERKIQSDRLFHLTKEQVEEEDSLAEKYQSIEKHLLRHSKDSKSVFKLANLAISNGPLKHYNQQDILPENKKNKRKFDSIDDKGQSPQNNRQTQRVDATLFDLHIGKPFNNVLARRLYNDLKQDVITLLDVQKYYLEKRYHCEILKAQKEFLQREIDAMQMTPEILAIHVDEENEPAQPASATPVVNVDSNNNSAVSIGNNLNVNQSSDSLLSMSTNNQPIFQMYASGDLTQTDAPAVVAPVKSEEVLTPTSKQKTVKKKAQKDGDSSAPVDLSQSSGSVQTDSVIKKKKSASAEKKTTKKKASDITIPIDLGLASSVDPISVAVDAEPPLKKSKASPKKEKKKAAPKTPTSEKKKKNEDK